MIYRLLPVVGQYQISDFASVSEKLYEQYGRIVRFGGLLGRPDLLFIYDADEIEKVYLIANKYFKIFNYITSRNI